MHIFGKVMELSTVLPASGYTVTLSGTLKGLVHPAYEPEDHHGDHHPPQSYYAVARIGSRTAITDSNGRFNWEFPAPKLVAPGEGTVSGRVTFEISVAVSDPAGTVVAEQHRSATDTMFEFAFELASIDHPGTPDPLPVQPPIAVIAVDNDSRIGLKWGELGGSGGIAGRPVTSASELPGGGGTYQSFEYGSIVDTPQYGAVFLMAPLFSKWTVEVAKDAWYVVGPPIADSFQTPFNGMAVYLERGIIVRRPEGQSYLLSGQVHEAYRRHGDVEGALGLPRSEELAIPHGGSMVHFDGGAVFHRPRGRAFALVGGIYRWWQDIGGLDAIGFPNSDEESLLSGTDEIGRAVRFQRGIIVWNRASGTWDVRGEIAREWERLGGATGPLGFPTSGDTVARGAQRRHYSNFQRGVIVHPGRTMHEAYVATTADFFLDSFNTKGKDGGISQAQELYVKVRITASNGAVINQRMPKSGDYGKDQIFQKALFDLGTMSGEMVVDVHMEGRDADAAFNGGDDHLGTVSASLCADNLWGETELAERWNDKFMAKFFVRTRGGIVPGHFREQLFWRFHNFSTDDLTRKQYAQTFSDVANDESIVLHPLNAVFYEVLYKDLAENGNCFGMCLESNYAQATRSMFAEPISRFGPDGDPPDPALASDATLINEINIKHGYQIGWPMVEFLLDKPTLRDPKAAFAESRSQFAEGDHPILCLAPDLLGKSGHAVRPYKWDDSTKPWTIFVADPNHPAPRWADDASGNKVLIDPDHNTFVYDKGEETWTGGAQTGGCVYSVPFHVLTSRPCTPTWGIYAIILAGDASTYQITDGSGRTLFEPGPGGSRRRWSELRRDAGRIPRLTPVPLFAAGGAARLRCSSPRTARVR